MWCKNPTSFTAACEHTVFTISFNKEPVAFIAVCVSGVHYDNIITAWLHNCQKT